jgi:hypothetical protein
LAISRQLAISKPDVTGSFSVARSIFSDTKSFTFTHGPSGSINQKLEPSLRVDVNGDT